MKLKKIASLMLAGVMAVSMLAGCSGNNTTDPENPDDPIVVPETGIVAAVNDGQNADNDVKITFTSDSNLDALLNSAVKAFGEAPTSEELYNRIRDLTGIEGNIDLISGSAHTYNGMTYGWLVAGAGYNNVYNEAKDGADGDVVTILETMVVNSSEKLSEEMAMKKLADDIDDKIYDLKATSYENGTTKGGQKYCDYSYTGNVSMVKVVEADSTVNYCFAYTITQTTSVKTLAPQA